MPIIDEQREYEGMEFDVKLYVATNKRRDVVRERLGIAATTIIMGGEDARSVMTEFFRASDEISRSMRSTYGDCIATRRRPEDVLADYGHNRVVIEYGHSNVFGFEGAEVVDTETESGEQALRLIEHCANEFKAIPGFIPLSRMPFLVDEAWSDSSRCAQMLMQGGHPAFAVEMCKIIVAETPDNAAD